MKRRALISVLLLAAAGCSSSSTEADSEPVPVVSVKVATAERGTVALRVTAPATIFPKEQTNVASRITAPIRELRVGKGDRITKGEVLAVLEDRDLRAQRAEAEAAVTDAQQNLQKLQAGTLPSDLERARGQVDTSQAAYDLAKQIYDSRKELYDQGAIPRRDLDTSASNVQQTKVALEVAKKSMELLKNESGESDVRILESKLEQARQRLSNLDAQLGFTVLSSPFDGIVTDQVAYPGDLAQPNSVIFTIMNLSSMVARAQVSETDATRVRQGQSCLFAPSDPAEVSASGSITVVNRVVDPTRRTVEVWCEIRNPPEWLRANAFGQATIITGEDPNSVLVPRDAVQIDEGTRTGLVIVVDAQRLAHERQVECGQITNGRVQILKGLEAGETVVTEGGFGVPDGTQVTFAGGSDPGASGEPSP